jgi:hypothetical protein
MREDFELAANTLIEVDPYRRSQRQPAKPNAQVAAIDFASGRGDTGVDLHWHTTDEFKALNQDQKNELVKWQKTPDGKQFLQKSRDDMLKKRKGGSNGDSTKTRDNATVNKKRKQWLKSYVKKPTGLKHVMSVLAKEETSNAALVASLSSINTPPLPPPPASSATPSPATNSTVGSLNVQFPASATRVRLNSIMNHNNNNKSKSS